MPYYDSGHRRHSIRLQGYDYSRAGAYFITICAHERVCLFGDIDNGEMILNESGRMLRDEWPKTFEIRTEIQSGEFVVMPNHFHGVVLIGTDCKGTTRRTPTEWRAAA